MPTIRARISKTIQERQYEPFTAELEATQEVSSVGDMTILTRSLAEALAAEVDTIIAERRQMGPKTDTRR